MIRALVLICIVAAAASLPTDPAYIIKEEGPEGRHVQMGQPGKSVSGYFTSRSADGLMEYKTMYEADENGYRARGDHLPASSLITTAEARSSDVDAPKYVFNYDARSHSHVQMGEPGKSVQGSYMYYDAQGRARTVNYEADENGYRVVPGNTDEKPVEISKENDATVVKAAETPAVQVAETKPVEPVAPAIETKPAAASDATVKFEVAPKSAPIESVKIPAGFYTLPVPHPGVAYYRGALPYVQPIVQYTPYPYSYGYSYSYPAAAPSAAGNYLYAL